MLLTQRAYFCLVSAHNTAGKKKQTAFGNTFSPVISVFCKRRKQEDDLRFDDCEERTVVPLAGKV